MAFNSTRDDEDLKESLKSEVIKRLFRYLFTYKLQIVIVTLLILLSVALGIVYPLLTKRVLDVEVVNRDLAGVIKWSVLAAVLMLINMFANWIWRKIMADVSNDLVYQIRRKLFLHIQTLGLDFFDGRPAGKILARVIGDVNSLKDVLASTITQLIPETFTIVTVLVVMLITSPVLTGAALISMPIILVGVYFFEIIAHKRWQIMRKKESNLTAFIHETLAGVSVIQSFNAQREMNEEFSDIVDAHRDSFRNAMWVADIFSPTVEMSYALGNMALYVAAIKLLHIDAGSLGTLTAFTMYVGMLWGPIRNLANYYNKLVTNMTAAERVFEIMDMVPDVKDVEGAIELPAIVGNVEFSHVDFAYLDEPDRLILKDVSFSVKEGETIALVGPTGAGKTTIVNLISHFYNVAGGVVSIDGQDISQVSLYSLRSQLGIMTQDNYLFSGTIRDNIRYGKMDATEEEIIRAAKAVHAHEFIQSLENGYDTKITERGGSLSIGQRQLIAFARTLVSDPRILILDEATSSIDTRTEILVQQGIEEMLKNRTSFVIAHRLSTIKNADRIFVIDQGGILEEGNHQTLMEKKGAYYNLYTAQFIGRKLNGDS